MSQRIESNPVKRETFEVDGDSMPVSDDGSGQSLDSQKKITQYSSRSELRNPIRLLGNIFKAFFEGRELAWRIFIRNLNSLYRQTALGLFWAFLPPLANTAIWIFLKSQNVFEMGDTGVDSTVYILSGMILWQAFIEAFQVPMNLLSTNRSMISRLNFPRESLLLVGIGEVLFNLAIRILLLIPAFFLFSVSVPWTAFVVAPFAIAIMVLFAVALGLFIMPVGSLYKDVGRFISMFVPFWMIITPLIYVPPTTFPGTLLNWLNPASPLLLLARDMLLVGHTDHLFVGILFACLTLPLLLIGLIVYRVSLPILIERMPN